MSTFTIVGAGQSGLLLGIGLLRRGHQVTMVTDRRPEEVKTGRILSTNCLFGSSCAIEREMGLDFWSEACDPIDGIGVTVGGPDGAPALRWRASFDVPAEAIDQRIKFPRFMAVFEELGGRIQYERADIDALERYARASDLVVVATGKSALAGIFPRDDENSPYDQPQRSLILVCVRGMAPFGDPNAVQLSVVPGLGEFVSVPGYNDGPYHHLFFEAVPGSALDQGWTEHETAEAFLHRVLAEIERHVPWEAERCAEVELLDESAYLYGQITPVVRQPVGRLPSGACVLGLADALVLNDPIMAQGTNNATKSAAIYLEHFDRHGDGPFDEAWMRQVFATTWAYARWPTRWTNAMLQMPPPDEILQLLGIAGQDPAVARAFVNGFDHPEVLVPMLEDPEALGRFGVTVQA